ncbi:hypothetical protein D3C80_1943770 [compost metagenome]
MPRMRCIRAAAEAPLCCSQKVISMNTRPSRKVALTRRVRPSVMKPRSRSLSCQVFTSESAGNRLLSM